MSHVYHVSFVTCWNIIEKCIATIYSVDIMQLYAQFSYVGK